MDQLREKHRQLDQHFAKGLSGGATDLGRRFLIDHHLAKEELPSIRELVRAGLRSRSLASYDWQASHLPLLICTIETGYDYEGNGTDFWPRLNALLGHEFTTADREQISHWFSFASTKYSTVTPGKSPWEQAFRHISWPITHAVAAKDIRQPFADCLRQFRRDVKSEHLTDATIVSDFRGIPTPVGSRRFQTWLERPAIVAGIVRDLLGGAQLDEAGLFSSPFRDRLIEDLRNEPEIRRAVRQVETHRTRKPRSETRKKEVKHQSPTIFGSFFLCQDDLGDIELCGEMPELPRSVQRALKAVRQRWRVRPWGLASAPPIPADCLRSRRGCFRVDFAHVVRVEPETPFFTALDDHPIEDDAKHWLQSVRLPAATMLAFMPLEAGEGSSHIISGRPPNLGKIWVVSRPGDIKAKRREDDDSYCREIGLIANGEIHEFDADNPLVREWLGWPAPASATQDKPAGFTWLRPTPLAGDFYDTPTYTTADEIGLVVTSDTPVTLALREGVHEIDRQVVSTVAMLSVRSKGNYTLTVSDGDRELESFTFAIADDFGDGFIEPDPESPCRLVLSHSDAGQTDLSRGDIFNRRLTLDVLSDRRIDNLTANISLSPGDATASIHLDRTPTRLPASHSAWRQLIQSLPASVLNSSCDIILSVDVDGLSQKSWRLEADLQELWWMDDDSGVPRAVSDCGSLRVQQRCLLDNRLIETPTDGDPFVSVAIDRDGNKLHFDARIGLIGDSTLHRSLTPPSSFLRQMDDLDGCPGLLSIAHRYLQVSAAISGSFAAEINRVGAAETLRSWVLGCVCGPNWFHISQELSPLESIDPVLAWWEGQRMQGDLLLSQGDEQPVLPAVPATWAREAFAKLLPERWWDGPVDQMEADDAIPLDAIYQDLLEDHSVVVDAEALTRSLQLANQRICGDALADLIVPSNGGDELLSWEISNLSVSDLAEGIHSWTRRHLRRGRGRRDWAATELAVYLNFLLYPERVRKHPWEAVLDKLLHDRCVARAGAFVAWRVQQNARLGCESVPVEASLP